MAEIVCNKDILGMASLEMVNLYVIRDMASVEMAKTVCLKGCGLDIQMLTIVCFKGYGLW